ncbi:hypothetical protein CEXT_549701 [Caerostris extrusa]|uniref:Uncharacterized protein n=1 Tax=Caerostris extrusa TaxID=172846 RepID=A0AAV4P3M7_CAEEX|nr:hypothetical protein CEXT_549701 [Caerostris extrusa]
MFLKGSPFYHLLFHDARFDLNQHRGCSSSKLGRKPDGRLSGGGSQCHISGSPFLHLFRRPVLNETGTGAVPLSKLGRKPDGGLSGGRASATPDIGLPSDSLWPYTPIRLSP